METVQICGNCFSTQLVICVCMCVCVCTSIQRKGFICMDQLECQGTDQQCCVEDVYFSYANSLHYHFRMKHLTFLTSHFILFTHQKWAKPRLYQCVSCFQNMGSSATIIRHRLRSTLHRKPICLWSLQSGKILNSSINGMLQKRIIPPCQNVLVGRKDPVPVFLLGDPAYPLLPLLMKYFFWIWRK